MVIKYVHRLFLSQIKDRFRFCKTYVYNGYVLIEICGENVISVIKLAFCATELKIVGNLVLWYEVAEGRI